MHIVNMPLLKLFGTI